jgi:hypothetical protein
MPASFQEILDKAFAEYREQIAEWVAKDSLLWIHGKRAFST